MDRATIVDRSGSQQQFIGANSYVLKANWLGGVTLFGDGIPIGFWWKPISINVGLASANDIDKIVQDREEHRAKLMGIQL